VVNDQNYFNHHPKTVYQKYRASLAFSGITAILVAKYIRPADDRLYYSKNSGQCPFVNSDKPANYY